MQIDVTPQSGNSPILPETRKSLEVLLYASGRLTDMGRILRFARTTLGLPDLTHRTIVQVNESQAQCLMAAFNRAFPDPQAGISSRLVDQISNCL